MSAYDREDAGRMQAATEDMIRMRSTRSGETSAERNARLRENRDRNQIRALQNLIADLAENLTDEGPDYSEEGLNRMRRRVANALPADVCPEWLSGFRDPAMIAS